MRQEEKRTARFTRPDGTSAAPTSGWRSRPGWPLQLSPLRLLLLVAFLVFAAELFIMLALSALPPLPPWQEALLDASILLLFLSPAYPFVYRPLKAHYAAHLHADREIRHLSREVLFSLERERKRFVQDLHDDCGQLVAALQLGLDILRHTLPPDCDEAAGQCRQLQDLVGKIGDSLRSLSARLRPALLETCGIVPALEWHVEQLRELHGETAIEISSEGCGGRFSPELEITLFRLCQEGLGNVLRHARARLAVVRLACGPAGVRLEIEDDGVGFDPAALRGESLAGLGLIGMRERAAALGGTLEIDTAPGRGTALHAFFPLETAA